MDSILQPGLIATLNRAANMWFFYRKSSREFNHWLKAGRVVITADFAEMPGFPASELAGSIVSGVDELLVSPRQMRGLIDVESHPDFWKPDLGDSVEQGLERTKEGDATEDAFAARLQYYARYCGFSRFDIFKKADGEVQLTSGHESEFFSPYLSILQKSFTQPRMLAILNQRPDHKQRGNFCTISLIPRACGALVGRSALGLKFEYS